jgi:mediator of RNA polymerase II transcription subunit 5
MNLQLDVDSLAIDLVVASFDLLSCAIVRKESDQTIFTFKSFLINKIPTLLATLSASMYSSDRPEFCIGQALNHVDPAVFPSVSYGMMSDSRLQDVRQEFLFSCTLHSLLRAESIEGLLGEAPFTSPPKPASRYTKESLVEQCSSDSERIGQLIEELEKLDGNAGAISLTVTEVARNLCVNKDTMALKSICSSLSGKPRSLDVIMQFILPVNLLQPICQLLDEWRYEEDQGKSSLHEIEPPTNDE